MRIEAMTLLVAAVLAIPLAAAAGETTITAPELDARVKGMTIDTKDLAERAGDTPVFVDGEVTVHDVDVESDGLTCTLDPRSKYRQLDDACDAGDVRASSPEQLISANVGLRFGSLEALPEETPEETTTQAAAVTDAPASPVVFLAAAAAGASLAGLYAIWRLVKWTGLAALIPLYSHISDDEILDDENRAAIYRLIQSEAGISTKDIADRLDLAWGTVTHHLNKLEKRRFVVSKKYGKYRRYFANGEGGTDHKDAVAVLRLDRTGDVAALIQKQPGMTQKAVSMALGVSSSTILWHVKRLEEVALIRKVREGKIVRYYPSENLAQATLITPPGAQAA